MVTLAGSGDPLGAWKDSSGNGKHLTQATGANKPTLATDGGVVVATFGGGNVFLESPSLPAYKPGTFFALCKVTNFSNYYRLVSSLTNATFGIDIEQATGKIRFLATNLALIGTSTVAMTANTWQRVYVTYDAVQAFAFYINGSAAGSGNLNQALNGGVLSMGDNRSEFPFLGSVAEWGFYARDLTASEIAKLDAYLAAIGL